MAQIFASDRGTQNARPATRSRDAVRNTVPEQALASVQAQADQSNVTARLAQLQHRERVPMQRQEEEELQMKPAQLMEDEELLQGKATDHTLQCMEDEEELMQGKADGPLLQRAGTEAASSAGGLPQSLQAGIEHLSGADMTGVKVHYNSSRPATVQAHAYAQGNDIHVAQGQERHLPHEAWHVAQQKQGRVKATTQVGGTPVNDDPALEKEADVMGAKASKLASNESERQGA